MPIYEYRRPDGTTFEIQQSFSDETLTHDPETGVEVTRVLHAPAVHFKGKGFYNTDYGTRKRQRENAAAAEGSSGKGDSGDSASSESSSSSSSSSPSSSDGKSSEKLLLADEGCETERRGREEAEERQARRGEDLTSAPAGVVRLSRPPRRSLLSPHTSILAASIVPAREGFEEIIPP